MNPPAVRMEEVVFDHPGPVRALDRVSLEIEAGEWVSVTGPSGAGKTTLLDLIAGLERPTSGRCEVLGIDLARLGPDEAATFRREHVGLVFQEFHLVEYLTALENVMLAQYLHSMPDARSARRGLEAVGLGGRLHHRPGQLSGGEKQRVSIARALANEPRILLADEPTGNLDEENQLGVLELFAGFHRAGGTLVVVTHDPDVAGRGDRIVPLRHGQVAAAAGERARGRATIARRDRTSADRRT